MATLKISDLSVGDWVYYDEGNTPCSIRCIYRTGIQDCVVLNDNKYSEGVIGFVDSLTPIPITAEVLEKNGWRILEKEVLGEDYEYNGEERVWDDENCSIEICEEKQGVFWYSWSNEYYMWRLEYVHQLQHLIRLAGVDKEINL
jgi:hypothetical protein